MASEVHILVYRVLYIRPIASGPAGLVLAGSLWNFAEDSNRAVSTNCTDSY